MLQIFNLVSLLPLAVTLYVIMWFLVIIGQEDISLFF